MQKVRNKLLVILLLVLLIVGCKHKESDAIKFKKIFDSVNGTLIPVNIKEDNPFVIATDSDIASLIVNKETFVVLYGTEYKDSTRIMIEPIIASCKEHSLSKVYFVEKDLEFTVGDYKGDAPQLIGFIDGEIYKRVTTESEVSLVIEPIAQKLNTCDISGC